MGIGPAFDSEHDPEPGKSRKRDCGQVALNDVEDLDETLARIKNDGEYLGEFSLRPSSTAGATSRSASRG